MIKEGELDNIRLISNVLGSLPGLVFHAPLCDFLIGNAQIGGFFVELHSVRQDLAISALVSTKNALRSNICRLENTYATLMSPTWHSASENVYPLIYPTQAYQC